MARSFISILLIFSMFNFIMLPVYATEETPERSKTIKASFQTDLNVNKASKGEIVEFITTEDNFLNESFMVPQGTIFKGEVKAFKKGRWAYRRAKVRIVLDEMIFPNGEIYKINGGTKRHVLKGSAVGNVAKGVITLPVAIVVGVTGSLVIIVETISIAGLLIVGPTSYLVERTMGELTHGINCVKHNGDKIKLRIHNLH